MWPALKAVWLVSEQLCSKLLKQKKQGGRTKRINKKKPPTPYEQLRKSADLAEAAKARLREEYAGMDPSALKKSIEAKLRNFFTALGNLDRASTKT